VPQPLRAGLLPRRRLAPFSCNLLLALCHGVPPPATTADGSITSAAVFVLRRVHYHRPPAAASETLRERLSCRGLHPSRALLAGVALIADDGRRAARPLDAAHSREARGRGLRLLVLLLVLLLLLLVVLLWELLMTLLLGGTL
jgi:hypothetical protein